MKKILNRVEDFVVQAGSGMAKAHTINEGLSFWNGSCGILLDYLFDKEVLGWSDMPDICKHRMKTKTGEFARDHILLFTHPHSDHYSQKYVKTYLEDYKSCVYGVGVPESNISIQEDKKGIGVLQYNDYTILIVRTEHQGSTPSSEIDNSMVCIKIDGKWYVQCGDSVLSKKTLSLLKDYGLRKPQAVFVNIYQLVQYSQLDLIKEMSAENVYCIHFPFQQDDEYQMYRQIKHCIEKTKDPFLRKIIVPEPMSRIL